MKIKEAIKRPVNQNIILMMITDMLCLFFTFRYNYYISILIKQTDSRADYLFYSLINFLFGSYIGVGEYIAVMLIFIFSVSARIIHSDNKNRIIAYRVLMGLAFAVTFIALFIPTVILNVGHDNTEMFVLCMIFRIALAATAIIGLVNTYSKRILK